MNFSGLYQLIMPKLEQNLSSALVYHDTNHTQFVLDTTTYLAETELIDKDSLALLQAAALMHDTGFLMSHQDHESISCKLAQEHLPNFGYSEAQIQRVCQLILSTKIPQNLLDPLSAYLCDADLYYLGTTEYERISQKLYQEMTALGKTMSEAEWLEIQITFLQQHRYFTKTAIGSQEPGKQANLAKLVSKRQK